MPQSFTKPAATAFAAKCIKASGKKGLTLATLTTKLNSEFAGISAYLAARIAADALRQVKPTRPKAGGLDLNEVLAVGEAAEVADVHPTTICRACELGLIPDARLSSAGWLMTRAALRQWLKEGKHKPGPSKRAAEPVTAPAPQPPAKRKPTPKAQAKPAPKKTTNTKAKSQSKPAVRKPRKNKAR